MRAISFLFLSHFSSQFPIPSPNPDSRHVVSNETKNTFGTSPLSVTDSCVSATLSKYLPLFTLNAFQQTLPSHGNTPSHTHRTHTLPAPHSAVNRRESDLSRSPSLPPDAVQCMMFYSQSALTLIPLPPMYSHPPPSFFFPSTSSSS